MDAALRARLGEAAGEAAVDAVAGTVSPGSAEQVEKVCAACAASGTHIAVTSTAARGVEAPGGTVLVSVAGLDGVEVDTARLVVRAGAGATLAAVRAAVEGAGMALGAVRASTSGDRPVGELVARGALPRRALTGVEAVLPSGERVSAGGAVLKDVAGYDLAGTLLGSMGRLALVTAVTLRLQPAGQPQESIEPAGAPRAALGDLLERAFDPQRLLAATS